MNIHNGEGKGVTEKGASKYLLWKKTQLQSHKITNKLVERAGTRPYLIMN